MTSSSSTVGIDIGMDKRRQRVIAAANASATRRLAQEIRSLDTEAKFFVYKVDQSIKELKMKDAKMKITIMETAARKAAMADKSIHAGESADERRRSAAAKLSQIKSGKEMSEELVSSLKKMIAFVVEHIVEDESDAQDNIPVSSGVEIHADDDVTGNNSSTLVENEVAHPELNSSNFLHPTPLPDAINSLHPTSNALTINIEITPPTPNPASRESTRTSIKTPDGRLLQSVNDDPIPCDSSTVKPQQEDTVLSADQLRAAVMKIYTEESPSAQANASDVNVEDIIRRLQPIVSRSKLKSLTGTKTGNSSPIDIAGDDPLSTLKLILNTEFPESKIQQQIDEKAVQKAKMREKKLWTRLKTMPMVLPPIHQHKKTKFVARYWDFDSPRKVAVPTIKEEDWEELKYCRYLRPALTKFHVPGSTLFA